MKNHSIIVHPANEEETSVIKEFFTAHKIKFEVSMEKPYDPEFVAKIQETGPTTFEICIPWVPQQYTAKPVSNQDSNS